MRHKTISKHQHKQIMSFWTTERREITIFIHSHSVTCSKSKPDIHTVHVDEVN